MVGQSLYLPVRCGFGCIISMSISPRVLKKGKKKEMKEKLAAKKKRKSQADWYMSHIRASS